MNDCVITIADLRKAIKGISGNKTIKIRTPNVGGNYITTNIKRVVWSDNWKSYIFETI